MTDVYWTRLNDVPLPTLPASEGARARKQFEEVSRALKAKRTLKDSLYHEADSQCRLNSQRVNKNGKDEPITPQNFLGSFFYWMRICGQRNGKDVPHWGVGDIPFSFSYVRSIRYPFKCDLPSEEGCPDNWKKMLLPEHYLGFFFVDWDQDGDVDIAFLLQSGRYVFFRKESCEGHPTS